MNELPLISVIIPVYNAEKYIIRCITSIIRQTYQNIEIIIVDDGSTDLSGSICDSYPDEDCRVHVVHRDNGGEASARNEGISMAKGQYIAFVDADDYVDPLFIEKMYCNISESNAQLAVSSYVQENAEGKMVDNNIFRKTVLTGNDCMKAFLTNSFSGGVWNKLFVTDIIVDNDIHFDLDIKYGPDLLFIGKYISFTNKCVLSSDCTYHYVYNEESIAHKCISEKRFDPQLVSWIQSAERLEKYCIKNNVNKEEFYAFLAYRSHDVLLMMTLFGYDDKLLQTKILRILKQTKNQWIKCGFLSLKSKLLMSIAIINMPLYNIIVSNKKDK